MNEASGIRPCERFRLFLVFPNHKNGIRQSDDYRGIIEAIKLFSTLFERTPAPDLPQLFTFLRHSTASRLPKTARRGKLGANSKEVLGMEQGIDNARFGAFVARLRKEKGLTQRQLAELVGVSDKAVSKWERGVSLR